MVFSEQVKYVRMQRQISQGTLAKELGVSYATVSRWERSNSEPQIAMLGKFYAYCEQHGISPNKLRDGTWEL